jgi:hypothetical protein
VDRPSFFVPFSLFPPGAEISRRCLPNQQSPKVHKRRLDFAQKAKKGDRKEIMLSGTLFPTLYSCTSAYLDNGKHQIWYSPTPSCLPRHTRETRESPEEIAAATLRQARASHLGRKIFGLFTLLSAAEPQPNAGIADIADIAGI